MTTARFEQIHEGMDVLDMDGQKIGKAGETVGEFFNVDAGFLGLKEYYVPFSAVSEVRDNSVFLNVRKDEIASRGWDQAPRATETEARGPRGTAATAEPEPTGTEARGLTETAATAEPERTFQLREEELQARKTPVETGRVQVGKEVVEEPRTMEMPVRREEAYIEHHPIERRPSDQPVGEAPSQSLETPLREERLEVEKRPVVYEEVGVGKRDVQENRPVSDTIRREKLRVDRQGEPEVEERG